MCLSPKSSRSNNITNINIHIYQGNSNKTVDNLNNEEIIPKNIIQKNKENISEAAPKKNIYKKILPNSILQFSSNNSTSSNTASNFNNVKTHNQINFELDSNTYKNPDYLKRNNKYIKNKINSNANNTKVKIDNFLISCKISV